MKIDWKKLRGFMTLLTNALEKGRSLGWWSEKFGLGSGKDKPNL